MAESTPSAVEPSPNVGGLDGVTAALILARLDEIEAVAQAAAADAAQAAAGATNVAMLLVAIQGQLAPVVDLATRAHARLARIKARRG